MIKKQFAKLTSSISFFQSRIDKKTSLINFQTYLMLFMMSFISLVSSKDIPDTKDLKYFPNFIYWQETLPKSLPLNKGKSNQLIVSYFDDNGSKLLYEETYNDYELTTNEIKLNLGSGNKIRGTYKNLQTTFSQNANIKFSLNVNNNQLYPMIALKPAGHSLKSKAILAGENINDEKHWKGFDKRKSVSAIQKVELSLKKLNEKDNLNSKSPFLQPMIGPLVSQPVSSFSVVTPVPFQQKESSNIRHEDLYDENGNRYGTMAPKQDDPLAFISIQNPSNFQTPALNTQFAGMPNISGYLPPDTEMAVGPNHILQVVNSTYQIFDKSGNSIAGPFDTNTLWSGFGGRCQTDNDGDAVFLYDEQNDQWILSQFAVSAAPESVCFAISQTGDPTGSYYLYQLVTDDFPDYYKLGLMNSPGQVALYMGYNTGFQNGYAAYAIDYENMRQGLAPRSAQFYTNYPNLLMPADSDGIAPAANTPGYFYTIRDAGESYFGNPANDSIDIYVFDVDFDTPANTTFSLDQVITNADGMTDFNWTVCGFFVTNCLPQPGTSTLIDSNSWWPQQRFQFRNFGSYQTLVGAWGVNAVSSGKRSAIRWFELRKNTASSTWTYRQEGTFTPDTDNRFSPSIAMDAGGNIGLGYSVTSSSTFPSLRYTVHDASVDGLGVMETEATLFAGGGSQTHSSGRWGDYSAMEIDPLDGCTFWFTSEYLASNSSGSWRTRIGSFTVPSCGYRISASPQEIDVCTTDSSAGFNLTLSDGFNAITNMTSTGCPSGGSCAFSLNPVVTTGGNTTFSVSNIASISNGQHVIMATATDSIDNNKTADIDLTLNVFDNSPSVFSLVSPADTATSVSLTPTLSWNASTQASTYNLEVATDMAFSNIVINETGLTTTSYNVTTNLSSNTTYYWRVTAINSCGNEQTSVFSFTTAENVCFTPSASIPDNNNTGVSDTGNVATSGTLLDLNVEVSITHTWVGDLIVTLTDDSTGTSVDLMDRPGRVNNGNGCSGDDVAATFDDGATIVAENQCDNSPAIHGFVVPNEALSAFNTAEFSGDWTINVRDRAGGDTGTLDEWCLIPTLASVNNPAVANDDSDTVTEDSGANTIDVLNNDSDAEGDSFVVTNITSQPTNGIVAITNAGADVGYTPNANYCNDGAPTDDFTYEITGGDTATVSITVTCVEDNPTAANDSATVSEDDPATTIDVMANDTDPDGGSNSIQSVTQPTNGEVTITNGGADLTYQSNLNYCNDGSPTDDFTYTLNGGSSATVSVTVTCVDDNPVAVNDSATVNEDSGSNAIDVLSNDTDVDGGPKDVIGVGTAANGTTGFTASGVTYAPNANYCGADSFTYSITGGDSATVSITVTCVDDNPVAVNDSATVNEDSGSSAIDVLANDTDVDGGPKDVTGVSSASNGTTGFTAAGVTYAPNANYCGADSFTYSITGGDSATVSVTVTCVDDNPVAVNDSATVNEDSGSSAIDVLANDTDVDGGPKDVTGVSSASNGTTGFTAAGVTYAPNANYCGADSFTYSITGGDSATVSVTITCVDDPSTANDDNFTMNEDSGANSLNVLLNDSDVEGDTFYITSITQTANNGMALIEYDLGNGISVEYTPNPDYCGSDSFSYEITGGDTATVNLTINCVNDQPSFEANSNIYISVDDTGTQLNKIVACNFDFGPVNEDVSQSVNDFIVNTSDPSSILGAIDVLNDGTLTTTFTGNQGIAEVSVQLQDDGGTNFGGIDTSVPKVVKIHVQDYLFINGFESDICQ